MAIPISMNSGAVEPGDPVELFTVRPTATFNAARDGQRFLVNTPTGDETTPPITVVLNWKPRPVNPDQSAVNSADKAIRHQRARRVEHVAHVIARQLPPRIQIRRLGDRADLRGRARQPERRRHAFGRLVPAAVDAVRIRRMELGQSAGVPEELHARPELDSLLVLGQAAEHAMAVTVDADFETRVLAPPQIGR